MSDDRPLNAPDFTRTRRVLIGGLVLLVAFFSGTRFLRYPTAAPVHPLTGRQIAGIATDARWLDRATREQEEDPEQALSLIGIRPRQIVADVGAGSGYMTIRIARLVGPEGRVFATDIQGAMLRIIDTKAKAEGLSNIRTVQGTDIATNLPDRAIDLALFVDVYHELRHPREILQSTRRALKSDGRLVLVEYRKEDPTIPIMATHRMSVADARAEVEAEGFSFEAVVEGLPRQHIIVFRR